MEKHNRLQRVRGIVENRARLAILVTVLILAAVVAAIIVKGLGPKILVECYAVTKDGKRVESTDTQATASTPEHQVIVTGPKRKIDDVVIKVEEEAQIDLTLIRSCDVYYRGAGDLGSYLKIFAVPKRSERRLSLSNFQPFLVDARLTMRLYEIKGGQRVGEVVKAINEAGKDFRVFADPNYLTGLMGQGSCGSPHSIGGSPHSIGGSPHSIGGSPIGASGSAEAQLYRNQWAFEHIGVRLPLTDTLTNPLEATSLNLTGAGVRVGVFDTSPFSPTLENASKDETADVYHFAKSITLVTPTLNLSVSQPIALPKILTSTALLTDVRDHGLFVAGLIHAIAPESDIHLIQVLDEYGCGSLFTLNEALLHFIAQMEKDRRSLDGVVINLSLGVQKPITDTEVRVESDPPSVEVKIDDSLTVWAEDTIESLHTAVLLAHDRGAVVIAAAGNNSFIDEKPLPPNFPAAYPSVIDVAASNIHRERACFSNWGDVLAPGGDGGPNEELKAEIYELLGLEEGEFETDCLPTTDKCLGECDDAVIGLMDYKHEGFAYWSGTSFSTPLVSGLAALVLDTGASRTLCRPKWVSPGQVLDAIRCGAPTEDGVINVPATLFRCLPCCRVTQLVWGSVPFRSSVVSIPRTDMINRVCPRFP